MLSWQDCDTAVIQVSLEECTRVQACRVSTERYDLSINLPEVFVTFFLNNGLVGFGEPDCTHILNWTVHKFHIWKSLWSNNYIYSICRWKWLALLVVVSTFSFLYSIWFGFDLLLQPKAGYYTALKQWPVLIYRYLCLGLYYKVSVCI